MPSYNLRTVRLSYTNHFCIFVSDVVQRRFPLQLQQCLNWPNISEVKMYNKSSLWLLLGLLHILLLDNRIREEAGCHMILD